MKTEGSFELAASKAGMDGKTARKYRRVGLLPSELESPERWRTWPDPFAGIWDAVRGLLENSPGLEAKTVFKHLQRAHPGRFQDGQLRTLQRKVKQWRATEGPSREVFFSQRHHPGRLCASDFTHMEELGVTAPRAEFSAPDLSLRADVLELGSGNGVLLGELREPERRPAERAVGAGQGA